jgi:hypothetical protein
VSIKTKQQIMQANTQQPNPAGIMQVGMGFWPSKVLLTAVNEGLFTHLAQKPLSLTEIKKLFGWNCTNRNASDFLDTLVAL